MRPIGAMLREEVDWDDVLPGPGPGHMGPEGPPDAGLAVVCLPVERKEPKVRKSRWTLVLPAPLQRTRAEELIAAARMRDAKQRHWNHKFKAAALASVEKGLEELRRAGILRDAGKSRVRLTANPREDCGRSAGCLELVTPAAGHPHQLVLYPTILKVAYSKFQRRSHGASAFGLHPQTVTRMKVLAAACHDRVDDDFLASLHASFMETAPLVWAAGMSADGTLQKLNLPMLGFEDVPYLTRSSWHVVVITYRASWVGSVVGAPDDDELEWYVADLTRPNVPLTSSESGECIWQSLYHVPQVAAFQRTELTGVRQAAISFLHWDLDGAASNPRAVLLRRAEIIEETQKMPLVSLRHCGCHTTNLTDIGTVDADDLRGDLFTWLSTGALLFQMGGCFLRVVQAVQPWLEDNFPEPVCGDAPEDAKVISAELMDYSIRNFKSYSQADKDQPWSSDSEGAMGNDTEEDDAGRTEEAQCGSAAATQAP